MLHFFAPKPPKSKTMQMPSGYRETVRWLPRIGDAFPDFTATTTAGDIGFSNWAKGQWTYFFSQPAAYMAVCTSELVSFAKAYPAFQRRGIQLMSISGSTVAEQNNWRADISQVFKIGIDFPGVADPTLEFGRCFGMVHPKESGDQMIRKSFVLDPNLRIRSIMEHPADIARNSDEVLGLISQVQDTDFSTRFST